MKFKIEISAGGIVYKKVKSYKLGVKSYRWLITQHSQHKGWGFPKGLVGDMKKGEPMEDAALREVREEGGITAKIVNEKPVKVQYIYQFQGTLIKKTVYYFLMEYVSGDPKDHDWEVSDAKLVEEEQVRKTLTYKSDKEAFQKILKLGAGDGN